MSEDTGNTQNPPELMNRRITFVEDVFDQERISSIQIDTAEAALIRRVCEAAHLAYRRSGLTYKQVADMLGATQESVFRTLSGEDQMTIRFAASMFLALKCDVHISSERILP